MVHWVTSRSGPQVRTAESLNAQLRRWARQGQRGRSSAAGYIGGINAYATDTTDVVVDIDGYFALVTRSTLEFYPLAPCRVADTRKEVLFPMGLGPAAVDGEYAA